MIPPPFPSSAGPLFLKIPTPPSAQEQPQLFPNVFRFHFSAPVALGVLPEVMDVLVFGVGAESLEALQEKILGINWG